MYKTILFDFDGTVFDTGEGIMKSVQYAAEAFGYHEPDWQALREFVGPPLTDTFAKRYNVDEETAKAMTAKYRERYRVNGLDECSVYPGVPELVQKLKAHGANVAVEVISELLDQFGHDGAVMIGDRDNDVRGAKRCDIPCIGVAWGYAEPGELEREGAIVVARDTSELEKLLIG